MTMVLDPESIDAPRLGPVEMPEPIEWKIQHRPPHGAVRPAARPLQCEFVVVDERGRRRASVPITFDRWIGTGDDMTVLGQDPSGSLRMRLASNPEMQQAELNFSFQPAAHASPGALAPIIRLLEEVGPTRLAGVRVDRGTWLAEPAPFADASARIPRDYADVVQALARIERRAGASLAMPDEIDAQLASDVDVTDRLLRGLTVRGTWTKAQLVGDDPAVRETLANAPLGIGVSFVAEHGLSLGTERVILGRVEYMLEQALLDPDDPGEGPVHLEVGHRGGVTTKLLSLPSWTNDDGSTSWVPTPMLDQYRGRWIAQSGTTVVAAESTFERAVNAARAQGRLATVWRVPEGSDDEAPPLVPA